MKVTINVDCTPAEARAFFGLPDLSPVHEAVVKRMIEAAETSLNPADWDAMMKTWMTSMSLGSSQMSEGLKQWQAMMAGLASGKNTS
ncbi:MAG: DUF6489 family protein [Pseudomonadota bacterium]